MLVASLPIAAAVVPCIANASTPAGMVDARGGTVGSVALAIGRQSGVSVSLKGSIAARGAPAIRGRMTARQALRLLAKSSDLDLNEVSDRAFILSARRVEPQPRLSRRSHNRAEPDHADPAPRDEPDIIVTASKRGTPLKHFAGQWSRLDGSRFDHGGIVGTEAIEQRTVGFTSTHLGAGRNKLFIRGIADSSFSGPTQSPVGQYLGDLRVGYNGADPDLRLVDMDSVEVMEGPQGTLYGAGALGGIILLKPRLPDPQEIGVDASIGSSITQHGDPGFDLSTTVNLPVTGNAALRITGYRSVEGGYIDNVVTGERDVNRVTVGGGRVLGTAEIAPDWHVDLTVTGQNINGRDSQYADADGGGLIRASSIDQPFESRFALGSLVLRKDSGTIRFRSTLGTSWQKVDERFDASIDDRARGLKQLSRGRQYNSETRIWRPMTDGWSWLFGFSRLENTYRVRRDITEHGDVTDLAGMVNRLSETTLYGEVGKELTDRIEATVGGRYTMAHLRGSGEHLTPFALVRISADDGERTEQRFLPSASILARPVDGFTVYARYQQGFRPGGLSIASELVHLFRRDLLATMEAGFRFGKPRSDIVDLSGSITRSRWYDIQADYLDPQGLPVTDNIGDGRIWSATLNGGIQLAGGFRLEAGAVFNDGRVTRPSAAYEALISAARDEAGIVASADDMRIPNIARWVGRVALDWVRPIGNGWTMDANIYARYTGHSRLGVGPRLGERQGNYFDSGLSLRVSDGRKGLTLTINNLTDSIGNRFAFGAPMSSDHQAITPIRPRTARIGFDWSL